MAISDWNCDPAAARADLGTWFTIGAAGVIAGVLWGAYMADHQRVKDCAAVGAFYVKAEVFKCTKIDKALPL